MAEHRKILITGASGAIGSSAAQLFTNSGWTVIGADVFKPDHDFCKDFHEVDLSSEENVLDFCEKVVQNHSSGIHAVLFNAATQIAGKVVDHSLEEWNRTLMVNLTSNFLMVKKLAGVLHNASLVFVSSVHARATSSGLGGYVVSKGALSSLMRVLSIELAEYGARSNAILPGAIESKMLEDGLKRQGDEEQARQKLIGSSSLKRIGQPVDVANLALFLASNELSGNITGQEFVCDGGVLSRLASE